MSLETSSTRSSVTEKSAPVLRRTTNARPCGCVCGRRCAAWRGSLMGLPGCSLASAAAGCEDCAAQQAPPPKSSSKGRPTCACTMAVLGMAARRTTSRPAASCPTTSVYVRSSSSAATSLTSLASLALAQSERSCEPRRAGARGGARGHVGGRQAAAAELGRWLQRAAAAQLGATRLDGACKPRGGPGQRVLPQESPSTRLHSACRSSFAEPPQRTTCSTIQQQAVPLQPAAASHLRGVPQHSGATGGALRLACPCSRAQCPPSASRLA